MTDDLKKFMANGQDADTVSKIYSKVKDLLTTGEEVLYIAVQKKPVVNLTPDCVTLTNRRVIICRPQALGFTMTFEDYAWKDVSDCHMKEELFGAEFRVRSVYNRVSTVDYLPKAQARRLYQIGQEKEEEQRELRRQRELEDKRAAAGGVTVTTSVPAPAAEYVQTQDTSLGALQKLKTLLDNGLISEQDFETKKAEILARL